MFGIIQKTPHHSWPEAACADVTAGHRSVIAMFTPNRFLLLSKRGAEAEACFPSLPSSVVGAADLWTRQKLLSLFSKGIILPVPSESPSDYGPCL